VKVVKLLFNNLLFGEKGLPQESDSGFQPGKTEKRQKRPQAIKRLPFDPCSQYAPLKPAKIFIQIIKLRSLGWLQTKETFYEIKGIRKRSCLIKLIRSF
jgi:hypothetical protein